MNYQFRYVFKDKVFSINHPDQDVLFSNAKQELIDKGIFTTDKDLKEAIDRQSKKVQPRPKLKRKTLSEMVTGAKAVVRYTIGNAASPAEVNRRAKICDQCPLKDSISDCMSCGGAGKVANFINKLRRYKKSEGSIPDHLRKKFCGMCGCSIAMLIVTKYEDFYQEDAQKNASRPDYCWLKKSSINFTKE